MATKTKRIISIVLLVLVTLVLIVGGVMKLLGAEPDMVMQFLTRVGFISYLKLLGVVELVIAALLLYPKTNKLGFLLASCYLSAAFSLELSGGSPPAAIFLLALLWISMFLKNKEMFLQA